MSWYKKSFRTTTPVEYAQHLMETNRDDIEYLTVVLNRYQELMQDMELIEVMVGDTENAEEAEDIMKLKTEIAKLKEIWNSYDETLRNFALFLIHNEEL